MNKAEACMAAQFEGGVDIALEPGRAAMAILSGQVLYGRIESVGSTSVRLTYWSNVNGQVLLANTSVPKHRVIAYGTSLR